MRSVLFVFAGIAALAALLAVAHDAAATHYRYGTLQWAPTGNGNEVSFTGAQAWRASAFGTPSLGSVISGEGSIDFGDGTSQQLYLKVVTVNPVNDWFFAQFVNSDGTEGIHHTYASPNAGGAPWVASWGSCCRISQYSSGNFHVNNPDQSEHLETLVDLSTPNRSPVTNLPPINPCAIDSICTIPIPATDDDHMTYRLSTVQEAGDSSYIPPGPPHAPSGVTLTQNGVLTWDTHGAQYDPSYHSLYSVQLMIQDGKTKTPLDFFLEVVPEAVDPPFWVEPPTPCGTTITHGSGSPIEFTVRAASNDSARTILLAHLGIPQGASFPIPPASNPAESVFTWTPTTADAGSHLVIFTGIDDRGYSTPPCPITIVVLKGEYDASGFGVSVVSDDATVRTAPAASVTQGTQKVVAVADEGVARVDAAAFQFDGDARFLPGDVFDGFAHAVTTIGVVEVPGVLRAEGVTVTTDSIVDRDGAESWSDVRFARLVVGGQEVALDAGGFSGPRTILVPGIAKVILHEEIDTGDGANDANMTAYALHVIFTDRTPAREIYLVSATANVGRDVVRAPASGATASARPDAGRCASEAWNNAPARTLSAPLAIDGDNALRAATGNTLILADLEIDVPPGAIGISVSHTTLPLTLRNVHFVGSGAGTGLWLDSTGPVQVVGSRFDALTVGAQASSGELTSARCTIFSGATRAGILLMDKPLGNGTLTLEGDRFEAAQSGVGIENAAGAAAAPIVVTTNAFMDLSSAFRATASQWNAGAATFEGNLFADLGGAPIDLPGSLSAVHIAAIGNVADANGGPLVHLGGSGSLVGVAIAGNTLTSNAGPALAVDSGQSLLHATIEGNALVGNGGGLLAAPGFLSQPAIVIGHNVLLNAGADAIAVSSSQNGALAALDDVSIGGAGSFLSVTGTSGTTVTADANVVSGSTPDAFHVFGVSGGVFAFLADRATGTHDGSGLVVDGIYNAQLVIAGNALDGNAAHGLALNSIALTSTNVSGNAFLGNGLTGVSIDGAGGGKSASGGSVGSKSAGAFAVKIEVRGNVFRGNAIGVAVPEGVDLDLQRNAFVSNIGAAILVEGYLGGGCRQCSAPQVVPGAVQPPSVLPIEGDGIQAHENDIVGNGAGVLAIGAYMPVQAQQNWWGDVNGPTRDGVAAGDRVIGNVAYDPWDLTPAGPPTSGGVP